MSKFVKQCRREWRRLGVPDAVASEMAADLTADLEEAEAEGASIEDVLGNSAFDPRSFASSWAAERGVSRPAAVRAVPSSPRWLPLVAVAALVLALVGALMVSAPLPRVHAAFAAARHALTPPRLLPGPPPGLAAHASTIADHVHALGGLVLIVGVLAALAVSLWMWRARKGSGGWNPPSAA